MIARQTKPIAAAGTFLALLVAGCSDHSAPGAADSSIDAASAAGLPPEDAENIKSGLLERLRSLSYPSGQYAMSPCTNVFDLGEPTIKDASLSDEAGQLRIAVPVTSARPARSGTPIPRSCYGAPVSGGGWQPNQTLVSTYVVKIEKWSSGWRMAAQQDLQDVAD